MSRAFLFVLDSVGIGGAPDAAAYGDEGANTLGHVAAFFNQPISESSRETQKFQLPIMESLGLGLAAKQASGEVPVGFSANPNLIGRYANAIEISKGKDTPSGHWEIAGLPVPFDWGYFKPDYPSFPEALISELCNKAELPGILGNVAASGTEIISELGQEHIKTGKPICYTSADSVLQIAAHETEFGLDRLYQTCQIARVLVDPLNIGRVIARPFIGSPKAGFERTGNRKDYAVPPTGPTLLDRAKASARQVITIGKVADIYAHQGVTDVRKANGNEALFNSTLKAMDDAKDGDLVFTNFVDFDMLYGHRRDAEGYGNALMAFDQRLPEIMKKMKPGDLMVITADHGCDPTWEGSDHTREQVPVLIWSPDIEPGYCGEQPSFANIGETIAAHLGLEPGQHGQSFLVEAE